MRSPLSNQLPLADAHLYGFLDMAYVGGRNPVEVARQLIAGGVRILQLRAKRLAPREILAIGRRVAPVTRQASVLFIINDSVEIARLVGADGVHLGQEDAQKHSVAAARDILGRGKIVGLSTHSLSQARAAQFSHPDYIGFGPLYPTDTKPGRPAIGLEVVQRLHAEAFSIPIYCIGGIHAANLDTVLAAGARRVAIVSAILCAAHPATVTREFKQKLMAQQTLRSK